MKELKQILGVTTIEEVIAEVKRLKSLETSNDTIYALSKMGVEPESVLKYHVFHNTEIKVINKRIYVLNVDSEIIEIRKETPEEMAALQKIYRPC